MPEWAYTEKANGPAPREGVRVFLEENEVGPGTQGWRQQGHCI